MTQEHDELEQIVEWFSTRDFGLLFEDEGNGRSWAHLTRPPGGEIVAPKYGGGDTRLGAARRAKQRFEQEQ